MLDYRAQRPPPLQLSDSSYGKDIRSVISSYATRMRTILQLCDSSHGKDIAVRDFLAKFSTNDVEVPSLECIQHTSVAGSSELCEDLWLPLPYHPLLAHRIKAAVREVNTDPLVGACYARAYGGKKLRPRIRVAWKNAYAPQWR